MSKDFQLFSDPETSVYAASPLFPSEKGCVKGKKELKRKTPRKSRFVSSQNIKDTPSPVFQRKEFPYTMVRVMVKKPAERRVEQEVLPVLN